MRNLLALLTFFDNFPYEQAASAPFDLTADADIGATVVRVSDRSLLSVGELLQIGLGADLELAEIAALPAPVPNPNPGNVVLRAGLRLHHNANPGVAAHIAAPSAITPSTVLAADAEPNVTRIVVRNGNEKYLNDQYSGDAAA